MTVYILQYSYSTTYMGEPEEYHDILGVYKTIELAKEARENITDKKIEHWAYITPYEVQED